MLRATRSRKYTSLPYVKRTPRPTGSGSMANRTQGYFYNIFDIRLIWAASLFDLVGGGLVVFNTLTLAMIAEAVPASSL